ncbi:MAG TPA: ABC-2 family transporter protein [Anaerolineales bacterium]|nr:ABC-2 family transporter protein [Anaerolineales bacterium]
MIRELKFLLSLWKTNLASVMEYRVAFLSQSIGMILNDGVYFIVWIIFFDRFKDVRGWQLGDMFLVFGVSASAFGLAGILFGNAFNLGDIIVNGRLDYYLSLPRPTLLHVLASRIVPSGFGDFLYGFISYMASGQFSLGGLGRFVLAVVLATTVFVAFLIIVQSLSFWTGTGGTFTGMAINAMVTFALYPITLFDNAAKFLLFTLVPAAFMGAVPAGFVHASSWSLLGQMALAAVGFLALSILLFQMGLRRYESGSAIQVEV